MRNADDQAPKVDTWESILHDRTIRTKHDLRKRLAALSVTEKIKILEKLRDRELVIAEARRKLKESKAAPDKAPRAVRK